MILKNTSLLESRMELGARSQLAHYLSSENKQKTVADSYYSFGWFTVIQLLWVQHSRSQGLTHPVMICRMSASVAQLVRAGAAREHPRAEWKIRGSNPGTSCHFSDHTSLLTPPSRVFLYK